MQLWFCDCRFATVALRLSSCNCRFAIVVLRLSFCNYRFAIRVLQSVGRILRKHDSKETATVYDIADKIYKNKKNYVFSHFEERYKYYIEEDFNVKYYEIKI